MAVDTNEVIQKAAFGAGVPSGPVPTGYGDWFLDPKTLPYLKPDVEGAKKLLAEAGYPNGFKIEIKCSPQYPEFVATTLVVQESLKKLNIDVTATQMEWGAFVADNASRTTRAARRARRSTPPPTRSGPTRTGTSTPTSTRRGTSTRAAATPRTRSSTPCWSRRASPPTTRSGGASTRRPSAS